MVWGLVRICRATALTSWPPQGPAADEIVMSQPSVLGPIDPQLGEGWGTISPKTAWSAPFVGTPRADNLAVLS